MAVHFVHIGKTGGTAIKHVLRPIFRAETETALGKVILHKGHTFKLADVPRGDKAIFCVRDPLSLFVSAFHSRLRKGQPKFYFEWSPAEAAAFERFPTPQALAEGLGSDDADDAHGGGAGDEGDPAHPRDPALPASRPSTSWSTAARSPTSAARRRSTTTGSGSARCSSCPRTSSCPPTRRSRTAAQASGDPALDPRAEAILREYYTPDYEIIAACERLRAAHGWSGEPPRRALALKIALGG